jgi:peroxiredoxin
MLLQPGTPAPDIRLPKLGGGEESLHSLAPVLLAFFKITCPICQFTLPYLDRVRPGIQVYGVSQNDADDTREFADYYNVKFPILLDPERTYPASNAFGITHVPTMFLLDSAGRIERVIEGWIKKDMESLGAVHASDNVPAWKAG